MENLSLTREGVNGKPCTRCEAEGRPGPGSGGAKASAAKWSLQDAPIGPLSCQGG